MKAAPMSRKVTQVTSHSPSHSSIGRASSSGWPCSVMTGLGRVAPVHVVDGSRDGDHAVDGGLEGAGQFGRDHFGGAAVVAEDRARRPVRGRR